MMAAGKVNSTCLMDGGGAVLEQAKESLHIDVTNLDVEKTKRSNMDNIVSEYRLGQLQREHGVSTIQT
jgi:hypothetical protein